MCTYNWNEQHPLLYTRAQAQAVCEQLGFRLASAQSSSRRPQRPRLIGANQDSTARIESAHEHHPPLRHDRLLSRSLLAARRCLSLLRAACAGDRLGVSGVGAGVLARRSTPLPEHRLLTRRPAAHQWQPKTAPDDNAHMIWSDTALFDGGNLLYEIVQRPAGED